MDEMYVFQNNDGKKGEIVKIKKEDIFYLTTANKSLPIIKHRDGKEYFLPSCYEDYKSIFECKMNYETVDRCFCVDVSKAEGLNITQERLEFQSDKKYEYVFIAKKYFKQIKEMANRIGLNVVK